jgi:hypothetical protein
VYQSVQGSKGAIAEGEPVLPLLAGAPLTEIMLSDACFLIYRSNKHQFTSVGKTPQMFGRFFMCYLSSNYLNFDFIHYQSHHSPFTFFLDKKSNQKIKDGMIAPRIRPCLRTTYFKLSLCF